MLQLNHHLFVAVPVAALLITGCSQDSRPDPVSVDADRVCGVLDQQSLEQVVGVPGASGESLPGRGERLESSWPVTCDVELVRAGSMTIAVEEANDSQDAKDLRASVEAKPRCDRVAELRFPGWICENTYGPDVYAAMPKRVITLTFRDGAARGISVADAQALVEALDDGIEALDARHAD